MFKLRRVATMPKQSLAAMRVALGVRAQYVTIAMLGFLMISQIIGVVIFSGKTQAYTGDPYNIGHNPYTLSITAATPSSDGASIAVSGKIGGDPGQTITIKLDGVVKGTTQATDYNYTNWDWSYTITGVTGSGNKTVTAEAKGETLVSAETQTNLPEIMDFYANGAYSTWHYQGGQDNRVRSFEVSPEAIEDDVHHKMYYISTDTSTPDIAIQDTHTRDFIAKLAPYQESGLSPQQLLLGSSKDYVYVILYSYSGNYGYYIGKISTATNRIVSTVQLTGNEAEDGCSGGYIAGGRTADAARALSLDESTLYVRHCGHVDMYSVASGVFTGDLHSGFDEAINGSLLLSPDGTRLYSYAGNKVFAYNTQTNTVEGSYTDTQICSYGRNWNIALTPDGSKLYVDCQQGTYDDQDTHRIYGVNTNDWSVILGSNNAPIATSGAEAFSNMVFNTDGSKLYIGSKPLYVLHSPAYIKIVDTSTQEVTSSPAATSYSYLVFSKEHDQILLPDSHAYSYTYQRGQIWDLASNLIFDNILDVANTLPDTGIYAGSSLSKKYVTDGYHNLEISDIVTANPTSSDIVEVGSNPRGVVADSAEAYAYVANMGDGTVSKVSVVNKQVVATIPVHGYPYAVALSPDGTRLYVSHYYSGEVSIINTTTDTMIGVVPVGNKPTGLDVSPDGSKVYVANSGDNTVSTISTANDDVINTLAVGEVPMFVRVNRAGTKVYVANNGTANNDTSISVITIADNTVESWTDASFASLGANNIDVSLDDQTVYLSTHSPNKDYDSTLVVGINAATGIDQDHPAKGVSSGSILSAPDGSSPVYGFGKNIGSYTVTATAQVTVTPHMNTPIVTITSPTNGASFAHDQNNVVITGTGPANRLISAFVDGNIVDTTTADNAGNWQYTAANVPAGSHTFDAKWIPAKDLAFIPYVDNTTQNSSVNIIDTATNQVIKTVNLPPNSLVVGSTLNHAGTKVYISGSSGTNYNPAIWEIDVATGVTTQQFISPDTTKIFGALSVTADDQYGYVSAQAIGSSHAINVYKVDLTTLGLVGSPVALNPINFSGNPGFWLPTVTSLAIYGNSLYSGVSITNDASAETGSVINLINNSVSSFALIGQPRTSNVTPLVQCSGNYVYFATNNKLIQVNPANNTVVKEIALSSQDANPYLTLSFAVDDANQKAYMVTNLSLYVVDIATSSITRVALPSQNSQYRLGTQLSSDGTQLYMVNYQGGVDIFTTTNQQFVTPPDPIIPPNVGAYGLGSFVGQATPPKATTTFTIGQTPEDPPGPTDPVPPTPTPTPKTPTTPIAPTITNVTPAPQVSTAPAAKPNSIKAPLTSLAPTNSLFALARRIPESFAIAFPWLLLLLALTLVSIQYYQVHSESLATKRVQAVLAKQQRLVEEQNNFVALTTHYLHTPLTVMEGEISLMVRAGTISQAEATKLQTTLTSLSAQAEAVLAQEEGNKVE